MKNVSYAELQEWIKSGKEFQLIDVREEEEHEAFNIGGELILLDDFIKIKYLNITSPIVVYCKRGIRSQLAIQRLSPRFPEADFYNLDDGILHLLKIS